MIVQETTPQAPAKKGLLKRLRDDKSGNTLAIVCASMIPILGMLGSGVDMSRAYLVKTRLQQACDAGALAGRKSMSGTVLTDADRAEAMRYFNFNFPDGTMNTRSLVLDANTDSTAPNADRVKIGLTATNQIRMQVNATMPNAFMQILDQPQQTITVNCVAEEYYVNTDVMLVLDTTGSMNCYISDATTCGQATEKAPSGGNVSKMQSLRDAVKNLYVNLRPAQVALEAKSLRMRIGFVMYASNANVGKLVYAENPSYINNPAAIYRNSSGTLLNAGTKSASWFTGTSASDWNGCIIERQTDNTLSSTSTSIPSGALDLDIATLPTATNSRWSPHIPSAYVQNSQGWTNYAASTPDTNGFSVCPQPAVHMTAWASLATFNDYIDGTNTSGTNASGAWPGIRTGKGGTYHDIGMIWGTRMIATDGIFGSRNPSSFNSTKVRRTIVLVTDGVLSPNADIYGAYGVERYDQKVYTSATSNAAEFKARHEKRFNLMCNRAKTDYNVDIWIIAMLDSTTAMTTSLQNCASSPGQALKVGNTTDLNNAFKAISDKVGNLRIGA